jgi:hypothetical protein
MANWALIQKKQKQKQRLTLLILVLIVLNFIPKSIFKQPKLEAVGSIKKVTAFSGLKLRNMPNGITITTIPYQKTLQILEVDRNGWSKVMYNEKEGFVKTKFLSD